MDNETTDELKSVQYGVAAWRGWRRRAAEDEERQTGRADGWGFFSACCSLTTDCMVHFGSIRRREVSFFRSQLFPASCCTSIGGQIHTTVGAVATHLDSSPFLVAKALLPRSQGIFCLDAASTSESVLHKFRVTQRVNRRGAQQTAGQRPCHG